MTRTKSGDGGACAAGSSAKARTSGGISAGVVLVRDREHVVEDAQALVELLAGDIQRRRDHDDVPVDEEVEPALEGRLRHPGDRSRRLAAGVERYERLARLAVPP